MITIVDEAIRIASDAHCGQRRKYTYEPYILHPLEVMQILMSNGVRSGAMLAAAVLHDVLEDCEGWDTYRLRYSLTRHPGICFREAERTVQLVVELTEPVQAGNRAQRKAWEAQRLSEISADAQTIKYADIISNTRSIVEHDPKFAKVYLREKAAILHVMTQGDPTLLEMARSMSNREM